MSSNLSAIDLLKLGDVGRERPLFTQYWGQILGVTFGILTGVTLNAASRRPVLSGIQKHIIATAGWTVVLCYVQNKREEYFAERDAVLRHYIELHPEDFPEPERKKIADVLEPWYPIR